MEEQDRTLEPEEGQEDVEAHRQLNKTAGKTAGHEDEESEDVEGHVHLNRNLGKDEGEEGKYKY